MAAIIRTIGIRRNNPLAKITQMISAGSASTKSIDATTLARLHAILNASPKNLMAKKMKATITKISNISLPPYIA